MISSNASTIAIWLVIAQYMMKPTVWATKRIIERWPSHIWYLILDSDVSPTRGRIEDPRVTGKKRNAQHMFPIYPSLSDTLRNLACHLRKLIDRWVKSSTSMNGFWRRRRWIEMNIKMKGIDLTLSPLVYACEDVQNWHTSSWQETRSRVQQTWLQKQAPLQ